MHHFHSQVCNIILFWVKFLAEYKLVLINIELWNKENVKNEGKIIKNYIVNIFLRIRHILHKFGIEANWIKNFLFSNHLGYK